MGLPTTGAPELENQENNEQQLSQSASSADLPQSASSAAHDFGCIDSQQVPPPRDGPCGELHMILGPMFAGKTSEMLRRVQRHKVARKKCMIIKYAKDTRYSTTHASTHDLLMMRANPTMMLADLDHLTQQADVIGIDEAQFYPDLFENVVKYVNNGKHVIMAALDGTFERTPFEAVIKLVPFADMLLKLNAVCVICFHDAPFTQRLTCDPETEMIGGPELYRPVCRRCYDDGEGEKEESKSKKTKIRGAYGVISRELSMMETATAAATAAAGTQDEDTSPRGGFLPFSSKENWQPFAAASAVSRSGSEYDHKSSFSAADGHAHAGYWGGSASASSSSSSSSWVMSRDGEQPQQPQQPVRVDGVASSNGSSRRVLRRHSSTRTQYAGEGFFSE